MINTKHLEKLVSKIGRLERIYNEFIIREQIPLNSYLYETKERYLHAPNVEYRRIREGDSWGGEFVYGWFKLDLSNYLIDENTYLYVGADAVEGIVFVNDKPYGMFDYVNEASDKEFRVHKYLRLTNDIKTIDIEAYSSHTFNGTAPYSSTLTWSTVSLKKFRVFKEISLVRFNEEVREFVINLHMLNSLYNSVEGFEKSELQEYYEEIFKVIEMMPLDGLDLEKVKKANEIIERLYSDEPKSGLCELSMIGHSHLDTAWLWKISQTKRKFVETVSTAVRLINLHPEYKFMMSSMLHFDWLKEDYPVLFKEVLRLEKEGKFEINGGTYVECECNMTGSESLVRQFLKGQRWMMENTNHYGDCFFLPDTFGYSPAIPQIMKQAKTDYFLTTKIRWNDTNVFPYETFYWQGIDGTKVLTHFNTIQANPDPQNIIKRINEIDKKHISNEALLTYGFGDGGGGCDETMVEYAIKSEKMKFVPKAVHRTVSDFMKHLEVNPKNKNYPVYSDELYLELHRATLTNNHTIKYLNRKLEYGLHDLDLVNVMFEKNLKKDIDKIYDSFMVNQFHDILPATCIKEANDEAIEENTENFKKVQSLLKSSFNECDTNKVSLFNPTSFTIDYPVIINGSYKFNEIKSQNVQILGEEKTIVCCNLAPYSSKSFTLSNESINSLQKNIDNVIETNSMKITFDENMTITSVIDLKDERELVKTKFNNFLIGENVPNLWDNWDMDSDYELKIHEDNRLLSSKVLSDGDLALVIENVYEIGKASKITQNLVIYKDYVRIDFYTKVDWHEIHKVLKAEFDTLLNSKTIRNEMQFGYVDRSMGNSSSIEQAQFEVCNHKYSSICENEYTLSFINDSMYGLSAKDSKVGLTMLTSGVHPDPSRSEGENYMVYSLIGNAQHFSIHNPIRQSYNLNDPVIVINGEVDRNSFVYSNKENIVIETVKESYDGGDVIVRLYEATNNRTTSTISFDGQYDIYLTNLLEDEDEYLVSGNMVKLQFRPFEIKTLKLKRK